VDPVEKQKTHAITCAADFPILSDEQKSLTSTLGILRDTGTAMRTTYVIDPSGKVRKVFNNVNVDGHVDQVLNAVKEI
jgi:thioredoxin-dependent peroxiredoxin